MIFVTQHEWKSFIIHDRKNGKFKGTDALNKLQIREKWAFFGPPELVELIGTTSLSVA